MNGARAIHLDGFAYNTTAPERSSTDYVVTCADGEVRHAPFAEVSDALTWAQWGHVCMSGHTFGTVKP